ncbi:MAG TPA: hypothetical protein VM659_05885 [Dongiaceae bacterium]|nr:hypothetical protein [Dongiaceae bacterium]
MLHSPLPNRSRRILGIDFSGAADAGRNIWIAEALQDLRDRRRPLKIAACLPAIDLPRSGAMPALAIPALARHILRDPSTVAGCDFPFSLPATLMQAASWEEFIHAFPVRFADPEAYRSACRQAAEGRELKRRTDQTANTPFCSYNLRLYRQAWWGMAALLSPLVTGGQITVAPQMPITDPKPVLIEICPASSLQHLRFRPAYKGGAPAHRLARRNILDCLIGHKLLEPPSPALATLLLDNSGGDALDAVIAAIAAAHADLSAPAEPIDRLEGGVYFELLA